MCDHMILREVFAEPLIWRLKASTDEQCYVKRIHLDNKAKQSITFYLHSSDSRRVFPYPKYGVLPPESQRYVSVKVRAISTPVRCKEYVVVAFAVVPKDAKYKTASQLWSGFNEPLLIRKTFTVQFWYEPDVVVDGFLEEPLRTPTTHFESEDEESNDENHSSEN